MTANTIISIPKGLDLPIEGVPEQKVGDGPEIHSVGLLGCDYVGMKPTMAVTEGSRVKLGQLLFEDKKIEGVRFTSPAAGTVKAVNRGEKRKFLSIVIDIEGDEEEEFTSYTDHYLYNLERDKVIENLLASGLWAGIRKRPYSKVAIPSETPRSLFVTAIDTDPLAADPAVVLQEHDYDRYFVQGLHALSTLAERTYLCKATGVDIPGDDDERVTVAEFEGPHPAGLPGTHMHFLDPVHEGRHAWYIGYQDVVAVGHLFLTGKLLPNRVVSLAGPAVTEPKLVRTRLGASIDEISAKSFEVEKVRQISGSVLSGRQSVAPMNYLGRYHNQVSILEEGFQRELLGWAGPGFGDFSVTRAFASAIAAAGARFPFTTSTKGSRRALVPIGVYEKVMPLDIVATPLLKSLLVQDTETAQMLGCLELDEEDLALCSFVCPGKHEYGELLRETLTHIEREG